MRNYGELKEVALAYAYNRRDLTDRLPMFLTMAERRIFRQLRAPANEYVWNTTLDSDMLLLPTDLLQLRLVSVGGMALDVIDDKGLLDLEMPAKGEPLYYARIGDYLAFSPVPDEPKPVSIVYYQDLTGTLINDDDTNNVLRVAPDLYVYGLMLEVCTYLADDARVGTFSALFRDALLQIAQQAQEAELAGSPVSVRAAYS